MAGRPTKLVKLTTTIACCCGTCGARAASGMFVHTRHGPTRAEWCRIFCLGDPQDVAVTLCAHMSHWRLDQLEYTPDGKRMWAVKKGELPAATPPLTVRQCEDLDPTVLALKEERRRSGPTSRKCICHAGPINCGMDIRAEGEGFHQLPRDDKEATAWLKQLCPRAKPEEVLVLKSGNSLVSRRHFSGDQLVHKGTGMCVRRGELPRSSPWPVAATPARPPVAAAARELVGEIRERLGPHASPEAVHACVAAVQDISAAREESAAAGEDAAACPPLEYAPVPMLLGPRGGLWVAAVVMRW